MQEKTASNFAPIKGRVYMFLEHNNIQLSKFCRSIDIALSAFTGKSRSSEFGGEILARIALLFPHLSTRWLLTGTGTMEETGGISTSIEITGDVSNNHGVIGHGVVEGNTTHTTTTTNTNPTTNNTHNTHNHNYAPPAEQTREICQETIDDLKRQLADKDEYIGFLSERLKEAQTTTQTLANLLSAPRT